MDIIGAFFLFIGIGMMLYGLYIKIYMKRFKRKSRIVDGIVRDCKTIERTNNGLDSVSSKYKITLEIDLGYNILEKVIYSDIPYEVDFTIRGLLNENTNGFLERWEAGKKQDVGATPLIIIGLLIVILYGFFVFQNKEIVLKSGFYVLGYFFLVYGFFKSSINKQQLKALGNDVNIIKVKVVNLETRFNSFGRKLYYPVYGTYKHGTLCRFTATEGNGNKNETKIGKKANILVNDFVGDIRVIKDYNKHKNIGKCCIIIGLLVIVFTKITFLTI